MNGIRLRGRLGPDLAAYGGFAECRRKPRHWSEQPRYGGDAAAAARNGDGTTMEGLALSLSTMGELSATPPQRANCRLRLESFCRRLWNFFALRALGIFASMEPAAALTKRAMRSSLGPRRVTVHLVLRQRTPAAGRRRRQNWKAENP